MKRDKLTVAALLVMGLAMGAGCRSQKPTKLTSIPGLTPIVQNPTTTTPTGPVIPIGPGPGTSVPGGPTVTPGGPTGPTQPPVVVNPGPFQPQPGPNQEFANFNNTRPNYEFFQANTIHFDYDSSAIRPSDMGNIEFVARHLISQPSHLLYVEGHCDERGTEQYNLSLGERRAQAVRDQLMAFGISADRVQTISYGEKQPVVEGGDETSYQANRRGEFVLMAQPGN
jgi:peptidoglycan-associated lipoprotein